MTPRERALALMETLERYAWMAEMRGDIDEMKRLEAAADQARLAYEWHCRPADPDTREAAQAA